MLRRLVFLWITLPFLEKIAESTRRGVAADALTMKQEVLCSGISEKKGQFGVSMKEGKIWYLLCLRAFCCHL